MNHAIYGICRFGRYLVGDREGVGLTLNAFFSSERPPETSKRKRSHRHDLLSKDSVYATYVRQYICTDVHLISRRRYRCTGSIPMTRPPLPLCAPCEEANSGNINSLRRTRPFRKLHVSIKAIGLAPLDRGFGLGFGRHAGTTQGRSTDRSLR